MILKTNIGGKNFSFDTDESQSIAIPLKFNSEQPNTCNTPLAFAKPVKTEGFIGDTRKGGSCNFEEYNLIPHCNGTHTECVGHISFERISIHETLKDWLIPAMLVSINPVPNSSEDYLPNKNENDFFINKSELEKVVSKFDRNFLQALIVRTLPNDEDKMSRNYMEITPPFFTNDAMEYIDKLNVSHLLTDIPSVDRTFDEGLLSNHHIFWNVKEGSHEVEPKSCSVKTITEMIFVPDEIPDGEYLLNLQIAEFKADASPSRPVLIKVKAE